MADYELSRVVGNVGTAPEKRQTTKGDVVVFSVAQPVKFGREAPDPEWYNVAVWDHGMQELVLSKIRKGSAVVVAGKRKPDRHGDNGKVYRDITAYRVGTVDYLFPVDNAPGGPSENNRSAQGWGKAAPDKEDDLPF